MLVWLRVIRNRVEFIKINMKLLILFEAFYVTQITEPHLLMTVHNQCIILDCIESNPVSLHFIKDLSSLTKIKQAIIPFKIFYSFIICLFVLINRDYHLNLTTLIDYYHQFLNIRNIASQIWEVHQKDCVYKMC